MNDVACFQLLNGEFIILFINYHDYLIFTLTDLSASDAVSIIIQGYSEEELKISSFLNLILHLFTNHQLQIYLHLSDFNTCTATAGTSKDLPPNDACRLTFRYIITSWSHFVDLSSIQLF